MSFSNEWELAYSSASHMSIWPWSDLVSYVMRYSRPAKTPFRILELGCGAGANISFFKHLAVDYHAIEGSPTVVRMLIEKYPELAGKIVVGDFTQDIPFETRFDLIIDRASLTHNSTQSIERCISLIKSSVVSGGKFIGIDWFSKVHSDFSLGRFVDDEYTKTDFESGQFQGVGKVHFSDKQHLVHLFDGFDIVTMEHKIVSREIPNVKHSFASFNFCCQKQIG